MKKSPLKGLVIRTAVVQRVGLGYIYACDPKREKRAEPHAITFLWDAGQFERGECNYDAHSVCLVDDPESALVDVSEPGYYSVNADSGMTSGDLFRDSQPPALKPRRRGIRSVSEIAGKAYAVGIRGMVYRLDGATRWTRIDDGLPETFNAQAAHGFSDSDLYVVGHNGEMWHYNGKKWRKRELPTNRNLTSVKCAGRLVYAAGHGGLLLRGRNDAWAIIEHDATGDDVWDLEWFDGKLYVSTLENVFRLEADTLEPVDFGDDPPESCYQLSAAKGVLWSNGEFDIMSFDGKSWSRVV